MHFGHGTLPYTTKNKATVNILYRLSNHQSPVNKTTDEYTEWPDKYKHLYCYII